MKTIEDYKKVYEAIKKDAADTIVLVKSEDGNVCYSFHEDARILARKWTGLLSWEYGDRSRWFDYVGLYMSDVDRWLPSIIRSTGKRVGFAS